MGFGKGFLCGQGLCLALPLLCLALPPFAAFFPGVQFLKKN
jgi:hypothetical protein